MDQHQKRHLGLEASRLNLASTLWLFTSSRIEVSAALTRLPRLRENTYGQESTPLQERTLLQWPIIAVPAIISVTATALCATMESSPNVRMTIPTTAHPQTPASTSSLKYAKLWELWCIRVICSVGVLQPFLPGSSGKEVNCLWSLFTRTFRTTSTSSPSLRKWDVLGDGRRAGLVDDALLALRDLVSVLRFGGLGEHKRHPQGFGALWRSFARPAKKKSFQFWGWQGGR